MIGKRIIIVGSPGSGKSTFARKLRDKTGLPLYYLDMLFHKPDRTTVSSQEFDESLKKIIEKDAWIIDGNYQRTLPLRFEACTDVFFFDLSLDECLEGAASRIGQTREDMPWVEFEFDAEFRQSIIDFPKDQLPKIYSLISQYQNKRNITIFHSRKDAEAWLSKEESRGQEKTPIRIRKATVEEMLELWGYQKFDTSSPTAKFFYNNITAGNAIFWTLDKDGELIGELYAFFNLDDKTFADGKNTAYLCAFRVKKEYRRTGNGRRLMAVALAELKEMGFHYATIGVGSDEPQNLSMYRHFGFNTKIKDCHYDPCGMDDNMQPLYEKNVWWLLQKDL